jgi:predicted PurR-regulated permease PerM
MHASSVSKAEKSAINWRRVSFVAGLVVAVLLLLWLAAHIPRTVMIFVIAAFIAFGLQPIVKHLEKRRISRPFAIAIVYVGLLLVIAVGVLVIVPLTIIQAQVLATNAPAYAGTVHGWITLGDQWLRDRFPEMNFPSNVFDIGQLGSEKLSALATTTLASVGTILVSTATAFFIGFSALVLSFLFLLYDKQIAETFSGMFPEKRRATAQMLGQEITQLFGGYISGQVIVSAITGVVVAIGSAILGFKFALILGIITAVAYAIPIFGMLIAQLIALILCAPQGWGVVLGVQIIMFIMARISDSILVPKIMGDSVGVSPIGVMFAVFAGGELFGLPGLILGIPAAALIKILWRAFVTPWLHAQLEET